MQLNENELFKRLGKYELEGVLLMNKDYQAEYEKAVNKPTYALLHRRDGSYYWVKCCDYCTTDTQYPYKQKWLDKENEYDTIKGVVRSNKEVIALLTWLNIKPRFVKEIVSDLKELVENN